MNTMPTTDPATFRKPRKTAAERAAAQREVDRLGAQVITSGAGNMAVVRDYLSWLNGGSSTEALIDELRRKAGAVASGDLSELETMLLSQAVALQAMFTDLARKAHVQTGTNNLQVLTILALKAAAGSRQAIVALAELRLPKAVMFAKQANVTSGPQQINNGVPALDPSRAGESGRRPNELLEVQHGERLEPGTQGASGGAHPDLAPVGALDRAEVGGR
jgi:hypothetical protein